MTSSVLIVGENASACESLAVLLRGNGHSVARARGAADAIQSLRTTAASTVLLVCRDNDVTAERLRSRIIPEARGSRVILISSFLTRRGGESTIRWGIGNYRLSDGELLSLLGSGDREARCDADDNPGVQALSKVIDVLVGMRELNDPYHRGSAHRSTVLARAVAEELELSEDEVRGIEVAALLRDIGEVEVQDLTEETGTFTSQQRTRMQDHVTASVGLLEHIEFPWPVLPVIRHHHEHYDGTGYPDGLKAEEIPMGARILAVVDGYVAMLSDRPHRARRSSSEAQAELVSLTGKHFDPEVVETLLRVVHEGPAAFRSEERPRLLIASADREFQKLVKFRLVNDGMDVDSVTSLEEGLLAILDHPPNLVLASVGQDKARTLDLLHQIREDRALRLLPIVLVGNDDDCAFKVQALRMGIDDYLTRQTSLEEVIARLDNILAREALRSGDPDGHSRKGITGQLENLGLSDIFQILNLGLKTARVTLETEMGQGQIWFDSGAAVHAAVGDADGEQACYEMLGWTDGRFCIEHGHRTEERSIQADTMFMVLDGLRRRDESQHNSSSE